MINFYLKDVFSNLVEFVTKYASTEIKKLKLSEKNEDN